MLDVFQNGVLLRTVLDPVTGDLSDTRTRYLGSRPVKLFRVRMQGQEAVGPTTATHTISKTINALQVEKKLTVASYWAAAIENLVTKYCIESLNAL